VALARINHGSHSRPDERLCGQLKNGYYRDRSGKSCGDNPVNEKYTSYEVKHAMCKQVVKSPSLVLHFRISSFP
jgi:hypothetical protein